MNNRRKLVIALGAGVLTAPFCSFAQQQNKIWRVGFLSLRARAVSLDSDVVFGAFMQAMRGLGYIEGKNLVIEWRFADDQVERLPGLAAELVRIRVDVIVAAANQAISVAQKTTATIPIVMGNSTDPVASGFVKSLAHPGGNITGLSNLSSDFSSKHLEMLLNIVPRLSRVALLMRPGDSAVAATLKDIQAAAKKVNVTILPVDARDSKEIESGLAMMSKMKVQAVIGIANPLFFQQRRRIAELAIKNRLPFVSDYREYAEAGCLMSYGMSIADSYRHAASYVDKILKGAKPADLPVEQPTKFELVINGKTAKALGLTIPQLLLISADKVIE